MAVSDAVGKLQPVLLGHLDQSRSCPTTPSPPAWEEVGYEFNQSYFSMKTLSSRKANQIDS